MSTVKKMKPDREGRRKCWFRRCLSEKVSDERHLSKDLQNRWCCGILEHSFGVVVVLTSTVFCFIK